MRCREVYMRSSFSRNLCKVIDLRPRLAVSWSPRLWTSLKPGLVGSQRLWCCAQQLSAVDHQFLVVVCVFVLQPVLLVHLRRRLRFWFGPVLELMAFAWEPALWFGLAAFVGVVCAVWSCGSCAAVCARRPRAARRSPSSLQVRRCAKFGWVCCGLPLWCLTQLLLELSVCYTLHL